MEGQVSIEIDPWTHAQVYVGNAGADYQMAGICQLELLKRNNLRPHHHVLEIGCGALAAGRPLIQFLNADRYVGIEPNGWLVDAAYQHFPDMPEWFLDKRPVFLSGADFDASAAGRRFDFVLSHSVLSHAAHWQLAIFLKNVAMALSPYGAAIVSLRMRNEGGTLMPDSLHESWQYPGVSYFALETMQAEAQNVGLEAEHMPAYREFFTRHVPSNFHDWIRLRRARTFGREASRPKDSLYGSPDPAGRELERPS
jgi:spermidine synthase